MTQRVLKKRETKANSCSYSTQTRTSTELSERKDPTNRVVRERETRHVQRGKHKPKKSANNN